MIGQKVRRWRLLWPGKSGLSHLPYDRWWRHTLAAQESRLGRTCWGRPQL
jgi:hypothetical protein